MIPQLLVIIFFIILLFVGFKAKSNNNLKDFAYSGRKVTAPALIATLVTTWYGGINEIGVEVIYNGIVTWVYFGLFYYIAALLYAYVIAPKIINKNFRSIPVTIFHAYGKIPALISLFTLLLYLIPAAYILILGQILSERFSVELIYSIFIGAIFSTAYTLKGGFSSILKTDKIQFIFMFLGFLLLFSSLLVSENFGIKTLTSLYNRVPDLFAIPGNAPWSYIIMFSFLSLLTFLDPSFHQRTFSGKDIKTVQRSISIAVLFWFIFDLMTITSALFYIEIAFINGFNIYETSSPYVDLAKIVFINNPFFMGIFFISILSVVMSTIDSYTFLSSITLKYDLNTIFNKKTNIQNIKTTIIYVLIISLFLSLVFDRALSYWYYFGSYVLVTTFFPLISTLFDKNINYVKEMMCTALFITICWDIMIYLNISSIPSIYIGLCINLLFIFCSYYKKLKIKKI